MGHTATVHLRDTLVLDLTRMLEATIHNCSQYFWLQQEVPEPTAVDRDVIALYGSFLFRICSILSCFSGLLSIFLLFVIQKIFINISISHFNQNSIISCRSESSKY